MSVAEPRSVELVVPGTRTLASVLREKLGGGGGVELVVAVGGPVVALPEGNAYVNVVIRGVTVKVPKLRQASSPAVGGPAYLLASRDFLLYIGTCTTT